MNDLEMYREQLALCDDKIIDALVERNAIIEKIMAYKDYLGDGYSANYFNLVKRNPKGNALYYLELYNLEPTFYNVYGYLLFSFFAKEKFSNIIKHPSKLKVLLLYIPVYVIYLVRR